MKKFMMFLVMVVSIVMLTACASSSSTKAIEGEYREFYAREASGSVRISKVGVLDFMPNTVKIYSKEYEVDKVKQIIYGVDGSDKSYEVDTATGVLTFEGDTYVKVGSEYYQQLLDEGAEE